ncbi:ComGF family competence protein [Aneurinibacillus sp. Ricciae_BoGa-3]|uniref:ComGF family competence protein n=1 Tax=Aneurinibacillus sp. Ricciae_BoGa-3 TaxID=3022697 RepID=UPI002340557F|nr:ComGF family competence protein [Aneurinibacillus sp. Ricciae_BoGa-3]WCK56866.1 ComGF family competence protein [Aneurinibacillus sp. Ricciae_BoGa-3]
MHYAHGLSVYTKSGRGRILSAESGFTLVEVLVSSMITALLAILLLTSYIQTVKYTQRVKDVALLEAEGRAFFSYIEGEIHKGHGFGHTSSKMYFWDYANNMITYEIWGSKIRRQLGSEGFVVMLTFVRSVTFDTNKNGASVLVTLERNHVQWQGSIFLASRINE